MVKSTLLFLTLLFSGQMLWAQLAAIGHSELIDPTYKPNGSVFELKLSKAKDQAGAEECFLFAYVTELETSLHNSVRKDPQTPALSVSYLLARKIQYHVEQTLEYGVSSTELVGGQIYDAVNVAHFYGVVPEQSWKPKVAYKEWPTEELFTNLNKKLKSWKAKLERLKESEGEDSPAFKKKLKEAKADTLSDLWALTGELPSKVDFEGKSYTPRQLSKRYGADRRKDIHMMYPASKWSEEHINYFSEQLDAIINSMTGSYSMSPGDWKATVEQIQKNVDTGISTIVGTSWGRGGGHMMNIVGYEVTADGEVTHLKILNSWGDVWGDQGAAWFATKDISKKYDQIWWFE